MWGGMGRCAEAWGDVGRCGEAWGDVRRHGEMWGDVGRFTLDENHLMKTAAAWGSRYVAARARHRRARRAHRRLGDRVHVRGGHRRVKARVPAQGDRLGQIKAWRRGGEGEAKGRRRGGEGEAKRRVWGYRRTSAASHHW